jgi:hypothetical protein
LIPFPEAREGERSDVGDGGNSAIAADTESSNSTWVILDNEEESMVSMN